jgi:hypothetical protein
MEGIPNTNTDAYYASQSQGETSCAALSPYPARLTTLNGQGKTVTCYKPGVYKAGGGNKGFEVQSNKYVAYLMPGVYRFDGGLDVSGYLLGGLIDNQPGVLLSVPDGEDLDLESAEQIALNLGDEGCVDGSCGVTPASDFAAPPNPMVADDGLVMTIYVPRDASCFNGTVPQECDNEPQNATVKLAGTAGMEIGGVIYAPTRNIDITGNSLTNTIDGQIVGWTLEWSGNSTLGLNYPDTDQLGVLRLDAACTGREVCNA